MYVQNISFNPFFLEFLVMGRRELQRMWQRQRRFSKLRKFLLHLVILGYVHLRPDIFSFSHTPTHVHACIPSCMICNVCITYHTYTHSTLCIIAYHSCNIHPTMHHNLPCIQAYLRNRLITYIQVLSFSRFWVIWWHPQQQPYIWILIWMRKFHGRLGLMLYIFYQADNTK